MSPLEREIESVCRGQMWTSAAVTTAASTAVRTCWEVSAVAVRTATSSTTSGTSVWVSHAGSLCEMKAKSIKGNGTELNRAVNVLS